MLDVAGEDLEDAMDVLDPDPWLDYTLAVCVECDGNAATLQRTVD